MKKLLFVLFAVCCSQFTAVAQIQTNAGIQYLQGMQKDVSTDFYDLSNIYFLADSLSSFDAQKGEGTVNWKPENQARIHLTPYGACTDAHHPDRTS